MMDNQIGEKVETGNAHGLGFPKFGCTFFFLRGGEGGGVPIYSIYWSPSIHGNYHF